MGTPHTTGSGAGRQGAGGAMSSGITKKKSLGGDRVQLTLENGEVVEGKVMPGGDVALPDGRIIRGAGNKPDST